MKLKRLLLISMFISFITIANVGMAANLRALTILIMLITPEQAETERQKQEKDRAMKEAIKKSEELAEAMLKDQDEKKLNKIYK